MEIFVSCLDTGCEACVGVDGDETIDAVVQRAFATTTTTTTSSSSSSSSSDPLPPPATEPSPCLDDAAEAEVAGGHAPVAAGCLVRDVPGMEAGCTVRVRTLRSALRRRLRCGEQRLEDCAAGAGGCCEAAEDRDLVAAAVAFDGDQLAAAAPALRDDATVATLAVASTPHALRHASERVRGCRDVVLRAVRIDGLALQHASTELRADVEVVKAAAAQAPEAFRYAADPGAVLKEDASLLLKFAMEVRRGF